MLGGPVLSKQTGYLLDDESTVTEESGVDGSNLLSLREHHALVRLEIFIIK